MFILKNIVDSVTVSYNYNQLLNWHWSIYLNIIFTHLSIMPCASKLKQLISPKTKVTKVEMFVIKALLNKRIHMKKSVFCYVILYMSGKIYYIFQDQLLMILCFKYIMHFFLKK